MWRAACRVRARARAWVSRTVGESIAEAVPVDRGTGCGAVTGTRPIPTPPSSPSLRSLKNGSTLSVAACWEANNPNPRSHA